MTARRRDIADLPDWPALMGADQAAAYCGMSRGSFELCVEAGRFPKPVDLPIRRRLWHRAGLDASLMKGSPAANDRETRRTAWERRQNRPSSAG